ncbi:MAG: ABA4-like family protein [Parvularculaceae bacterium]
MQINAETLFGLGNQFALIGWIVLILLPRRFPLLLAIPKFAIPTLLALAYAGLIATTFFSVEGGGFGSIGQVRALFAVDEMLVAGWLHYLAFDLFVGVWIAERSDAAGIPRLIQAAFLLATFMFGPVGLLLYFVTRGALPASMKS